MRRSGHQLQFSAADIDHQALIGAAGSVGDTLVNQARFFFAADHLRTGCRISCAFARNSPALTARRGVAVATTRICVGGISLQALGKQA